MENRKVISVTVEYADGNVETYNGVHDIRHTSRRRFRKGEKNIDQAHVRHDISWIQEPSKEPNVEATH